MCVCGKMLDFALCECAVFFALGVSAQCECACVCLKALRMRMGPGS